MRKIGVHHDNMLDADILRQLLKRVKIRLAQTFFFLSPEERHLLVRGGDSSDDIGRAVGGIVVHHHNMNMGHQLEYLRNKRLNIISLIIGRNDDDRFHANQYILFPPHRQMLNTEC